MYKFWKLGVIFQEAMITEIIKEDPEVPEGYEMIGDGSKMDEKYKTCDGDTAFGPAFPFGAE